MTTQQASPQQAEAFAGLMKEIGSKAIGWRALVVALSRLPLLSDRNRLAPKVVEQINAAVQVPHGIITLPNCDVCVLLRDAKGLIVRELALRINEYLTTGLGPKAWSLIRVFNLEASTSDFIAVISGVDKATMTSAASATSDPLAWKYQERPSRDKMVGAGKKDDDAAGMETASGQPLEKVSSDAVAAVRKFVVMLAKESSDNMVSLDTVQRISSSFVEGGGEKPPPQVPQSPTTILSVLPPAVTSALSTGVTQLDTALKEQENAVGRILGLAETLMSRAGDRPTRIKLEGLMEACSFQDLTGQRIRKVGRLLKFLATSKSISAYGELPQQPELTESKGLSQAEVDRLLNG
ncbi:MAG: protein phosphatase CheZ [Alphaproteobacteria bacterium]